VSGATLGVILAGGRSRRFGAPKALAEVGGVPIAARVRDALAAAVPAVVLVANEPALFSFLHLSTRPDLAPGSGPLAGVHTALHWAAERGCEAALCVACDLPFVTSSLLRTLVRRAREAGAPALAPEGPEGAPEPLCAVYSVRCLPRVAERLERGEGGMRQLLAAVGAAVLPLAEVRRHGIPERLFLNVNTPGEHRRADGIARAHDPAHAE
jgi:molybdopterin-guanine dinucleotide biosynthesis protein A